MSRNCLNCGNSLETGQAYCPSCGQTTTIHRFTFSHLIHEFTHAFTHADKGIFFLLKELALRPGTVVREYIDGKRKKYFSPFTFFVLLMGLFVFSNTFFKEPTNLSGPDPKVLANIPTKEGKEKYVVMSTRASRVGNFMAKHSNIVALIAVPFISLIFWLFFHRKKYGYTEHLVANLYLVTFANMVFTFLIFPLQKLLAGSGVNRFVFFALLLQAIYLAWAYNGFLQLKTVGERFKSFLASFTAIILWMIVSLSAMAIYIYRSGDFYRFFSQMMNR